MIIYHSYRHRGNLKKHVDGVHKKVKRFTCEQCNFSTPYNNALEGHVKAVHDKIKELACGRCEYRTGSRSNLKSHIKAVHDNIRDFCCGDCSFTTAKLDNLKKHIRVVHEKVKEFKCEECSYRTGLKYNLESHVKSKHNTSKTKDFACVDCDYTTHYKRSMQYHVKAVHDKIKDSECGLCGYRTGNAASLSAHVKFVHDKILPFSCEKCDYKSAYKKDVQKHTDSKHNGLQWRSKSSPRRKSSPKSKSSPMSKSSPRRKSSPRLKKIKTEGKILESQSEDDPEEFKPEEKCLNKSAYSKNVDSVHTKVEDKSGSRARSKSNTRHGQIRILLPDCWVSLKSRSIDEFKQEENLSVSILKNKPIKDINEEETEKNEKTLKSEMKCVLENVKMEGKGIDIPSKAMSEEIKKELKGLKTRRKYVHGKSKPKKNYLKSKRNIKIEENGLGVARKDISENMKRDEEGQRKDVHEEDEGVNVATPNKDDQENIEIEGRDLNKIHGKIVAEESGPNSPNQLVCFLLPDEKGPSAESSDVEKLKKMMKSLKSYTKYIQEQINMKEEGHEIEGEEKACDNCELSTSSEKHLKVHVEAHQAMESMSDGMQQHIGVISSNFEQEGKRLMDLQQQEKMNKGTRGL